MHRLHLATFAFPPTQNPPSKPPQPPHQPCWHMRSIAISLSPGSGLGGRCLVVPARVSRGKLRGLDDRHAALRRQKA